MELEEDGKGPDRQQLIGPNYILQLWETQQRKLLLGTPTSSREQGKTFLGNSI